jgi:hypothetical protein
MNVSNSWAEFAGLFCETREYEWAKSELKGLMPEEGQGGDGPWHPRSVSELRPPPLGGPTQPNAAIGHCEAPQLNPGLNLTGQPYRYGGLAAEYWRGTNSLE